MYDATALTTPAPAKGPHFRAVYDTPTSNFMLNLATNQAELQDTKPQAFRFKGLFRALVKPECRQHAVDVSRRDRVSRALWLGAVQRAVNAASL